MKRNRRFRCLFLHLLGLLRLLIHVLLWILLSQTFPIRWRQLTLLIFFQLNLFLNLLSFKFNFAQLFAGIFPPIVFLPRRKLFSFMIFFLLYLLIIYFLLFILVWTAWRWGRFNSWLLSQPFSLFFFLSFFPFLNLLFLLLLFLNLHLYR